MSEEKIEIGSGAVYLEKERLEPEKMAERFVQCGVRIPNRRRPPRGAVAGKDGKKYGEHEVDNHIQNIVFINLSQRISV